MSFWAHGGLLLWVCENCLWWASKACSMKNVDRWCIAERFERNVFFFWCSVEIIKGSDCLISSDLSYSFHVNNFHSTLLPCMTRHWIWPNLKSISCWLGLFWLVIWGWWQTVFVYLPQRHNNRQHTWLDDTWAAWLCFSCTAVVIWLLYSSWLELLFIVYLDIEQLFVFVFELSLP